MMLSRHGLPESPPTVLSYARNIHDARFNFLKSFIMDPTLDSMIIEAYYIERFDTH